MSQATHALNGSAPSGASAFAEDTDPASQAEKLATTLMMHLESAAEALSALRQFEARLSYYQNFNSPPLVAALLHTAISSEDSEIRQAVYAVLLQLTPVSWNREHVAALQKLQAREDGERFISSLLDRWQDLDGPRPAPVERALREFGRASSVPIPPQKLVAAA